MKCRSLYEFGKVMGLWAVLGLGMAGGSAEGMPKEKNPDKCNNYRLKWDLPDLSKIPFSSHLLWKVTSPAGKENLVLGLTHAVPGSELRKWDWLQLVVRTSRIYLSEIPLAAENLENLKEMQTTGKSILPELPKSFRDDLMELLRAKDLEHSGILNMKPWSLYSAVGSFVERGFKGVDQVLYFSAQTYHVPILPLETEQELERHFTHEIPYQTHLETLKDTICSHDQVIEQSRRIVESFVRQDAQGLFRAGFGLVSAVGNRSEVFVDKLVNRRNVLFVSKMMPELNQGGSFTALGALHLAGDKGILQLLSRQGFKVEPYSLAALKTKAIASADARIVDEAIREAGAYLNSQQPHLAFDFTRIKSRVMAQDDMDQLFCGGANCGARAFHKDGELTVSNNLLLQLALNQIQAQGIIVHETTHYRQGILRGADHPAPSCKQWQELELEALTAQSNYLQLLGQVLPHSTAHYGGACQEELPTTR